MGRIPAEGAALFVFGPLGGLLLGVGRLPVPWQALLLSIGVYVALPLVAGYLSRKAIIAARKLLLEAVEPPNDIGWTLRVSKAPPAEVLLSWQDAPEDAFVPGLMHVNLGGYHVRDIEFVAAFDVNASVNWSALAAEYGWCDQAHFNRDFKRLANEASLLGWHNRHL